MVWNATLGGNNSPEEEQQIASSIKSLANDIGAGVSFWTSNTPIDIDALETESVAPQVPAKKATK